MTLMGPFQVSKFCDSVIPNQQEPFPGSSLHLSPQALLAPKEVSLSALCQAPRATGSAHGVGVGGLSGHSTSSSAPQLSSPLTPSSAVISSRAVSQPRLLARVPPSGQAFRAGGTLEEGPLPWSSFRFAEQRPPPPLQEQSLGSRNPEHPCARLAMSLFPSCRQHPQGHHLFFGRGKSLSPLPTWGREWGEAMSPVTSPLPQASPPSSSVVL